MKREYTVVIQKGESGMLIGSVPEVPRCFTQGADVSELLENIRDVLRLCLEENGDGDPPEANLRHSPNSGVTDLPAWRSSSRDSSTRVTQLLTPNPYSFRLLPRRY